ncbi:hypothetical protein HETIRDRAFT_425345 [Heterobasidion irregulare TC 32-1]|uniref:Uncharacterized protein n=1 Tax=Heterobasidion irregulare (strain TC 32-1) TaxID=747525 RepID=W4KD14_HETIT|nr:uncharacterized protein HETIRDRAFT_425345 [Heterobasidion irregulare TC 32-1]ETW83678.1 hypothetical protein HETIRDRAFT_425345 [Heterobasidion irregulare TC 32-1]
MPAPAVLALLSGIGSVSSNAAGNVAGSAIIDILGAIVLAKTESKVTEQCIKHWLFSNGTSEEAKEKLTNTRGFGLIPKSRQYQQTADNPFQDPTQMPNFLHRAVQKPMVASSQLTHSSGQGRDKHVTWATDTETVQSENQDDIALDIALNNVTASDITSAGLPL